MQQERGNPDQPDRSTRIRLLGTLEITRADGAPVPPLGRRTVALLACLALAPAPWPRDELAELLWPDRSPEQKRGSLRQEFLRLRQALGWPAGHRGGAGLPLWLPPDRAAVDVTAFRAAAADPTRAVEAVALYRGPLLQAFRTSPSDPFAVWLQRERAALHATAVTLMLRLLERPDASPALAERLLGLEPACEPAHRFLMRRYAAARDLPGVLAQFRACADAVRASGAGDPTQETRALLDALAASPPAPAIAGSPQDAPPAIAWLRHAPDRAPVPTAPPPQMLPPIEDKPSVAVLPFEDQTLDPLARPVLGEGLTEEITHALARIPGFFVTARHSALAYRGVARDLRLVAAELGVRYLIEGSVTQDRPRMRANLRLIDGRTGQHIWAETQGGPMDDLMEIRDRVVHRLATRLQPRLLMEEIRRAVRRPPQDLDAWSWLQRANAILLGGRHADALQRVLDPLHQSLRADPDYAMAKALLSAVHAWRAVSREFPDPEGEKATARRLAEEALALEEDNPFVLVHCAETAMYCSAEIDAALVLLETSVQRDPNDANGQALLAHVRRTAGESPTGSLALIDHATRLSPRDPRSFLWHHYASWCHYRLGDLDGMEAASRRSVELYGRYPLSWIGLTSALGLQGRMAEAREAGRILRRMRPSFTAEGFYQTARALYGPRFPGAVDAEYQALRSALARACED